MPRSRPRTDQVLPLSLAGVADFSAEVRLSGYDRAHALTPREACVARGHAHDDPRGDLCAGQRHLERLREGKISPRRAKT